MSAGVRAALCALIALAGARAGAQVAPPPADFPSAAPLSAPAGPVPPEPAPFQSAAEAIAQDGAAVADRLGTSPAEAARQLRLQQASVAATDAIAARFAGRLAGIAVEHRPAFRIDVLLTGDEPVPDEVLLLPDGPVAVAYRTGARASHAELVSALSAFQATIRASLLAPPGMGIDPRTGELVVIVSRADVAREERDALAARLAVLTGVPVRLRVVDEPALDLLGADPSGGGGGGTGTGGGGGGIEGGARVTGSVPGDAHRYLCTAGFVVTNGARDALVTAAHCPDTLAARGADGREQVLPFVGQWGWGNQDVQVNESPGPLPPAFFADAARRVSRPVTGARARAGMRAGDVVCHRGERTGYSCSEVELTDFAPAGDLCGGACLATWTTAAGPACGGGDSGGPVFLGTRAIGLLKGGSYRADGSCAFYFFMSTDYLPAGWRLLTAEPADTPPDAPFAAVPPPAGETPGPSPPADQ